MNQAPYPYRRELETRYTFVSEGKKTITKVVQFFITDVENLYCLGFGDLLDDSNVDDTINSNNGDIARLVATVMKIAERFSEELPKSKIYFTGSSPGRTRFYNRIIKTYYRALSRQFKITAVRDIGKGFLEEVYNENDNSGYVAFFLKRIE